MADFIPLDPYAAQRGVQMIEQANLIRAQAAETIANAEAKRQDTAMRGDAFKRTQEFMAEVAKGETVNAPPMVPGVDFPSAADEVDPGPKRPSLDPLKSNVPEWKKQLNEADKQTELARLARQKGLPDDKFVDNARLLRESGMKGQQDAENASIKGLEHGLSLLNTIDGPETAQRILSQMERGQAGLPEKFGFQKGMDGRFIWDDNAVEQLGTLKQWLGNTLDERKFKLEQERLEVQRQEHERRERRDEQRAQVEDQLAQARRDRNESEIKRLELLKERLEDKERRLDDKAVTVRSENVQKRLDKQPAYKVFPFYEQAQQQQLAIRDVIADDKTYKNINAPQIDTLTKAYNAMAGQFRQQRAGTKFETENVRAFNGFMQNTEKWLATLGKGTPQVNRTTALQISDAMNNMYAIAAGEALKAELEAQTTKGVDPTLLQLRVVNDEQTLMLLQQKGYLKVVERGADGLPLKIKIFGNTYDAPKR